MGAQAHNRARQAQQDQAASVVAHRWGERRTTDKQYLATDEQQAQTIKPPTTEERRDQRRPDLEEDNDFDIHM